jgi:hypothetical protein
VWFISFDKKGVFIMMNMVGFRPQVTAAPKFQAASFVRQKADSPIDEVLQYIEASAISKMKPARQGVLSGAEAMMTLESPAGFNPAPYFVQGFKSGVEPYTQLGGIFGDLADRAASEISMDNFYPVVKKCVNYMAQNDPDAGIKAQAQELSRLFRA